MKTGAFDRTDRVLVITFLVGVISIIYFVTSLYLLESDPVLTGIPESYLSWMMMERFIMTGIIFVILIIITYVLMAQKNLEEMQATGAGQRKAAVRISEKSIKEEMMMYYRDMGALKIVLKDGVMDAEMYNERRKYLEDLIKKKKKQLEQFQHDNKQPDK